MRRLKPRRAAMLLAALLLVSGGLLSPTGAEAQGPASCFSSPQVTGQTTWPRPTGPSSGELGTTVDLAVDGQEATWFQSTHGNWQYIQLDYGCVGELRSIDRLMSKNGRIAGTRGAQGEGVSYSADGATFTDLSEATTSGWERYNDYSPRAWHSVDYGWSGRLTLDAPAQARYVRFNWDGNADALNELLVDWRPPSIPPIDVDLFCEPGTPICDATATGGDGTYTFNWTVVHNVTGLRVVSNGALSNASGRCDHDFSQHYTMQVTVRDSGGRIDTASLTRACAEEPF